MGYFNFFDEWAMDPKVQSLPEDMQRRHAMLLCLRNIGDTSETPDDEVATFMRITIEEAERTKELFRRKLFISGGGWHVTNWDKRQSGQSESYARVKRWRAARRNGTDALHETLHETDGNVSETTRETALARVNLLTNELTNELSNKEKKEPRKRGKPSATADDCSLPHWLPKENLTAWLEHRKRIKHPVAPESLPDVIALLEQYRSDGCDPLASLRAGIVGGYQGLFPQDQPKGKGSKATPAVIGLTDEQVDANKKARRAEEDRLQRDRDAQQARKPKADEPAVPRPVIHRPSVQKSQSEVLADIERMKKRDGIK
jgi:hypothetical protein